MAKRARYCNAWTIFYYKLSTRRTKRNSASLPSKFQLRFVASRMYLGKKKTLASTFSSLSKASLGRKSLQDTRWPFSPFSSDFSLSYLLWSEASLPSACCCSAGTKGYVNSKIFLFFCEKGHFLSLVGWLGEEPHIEFYTLLSIRSPWNDHCVDFSFDRIICVVLILIVTQTFLRHAPKNILFGFCVSNSFNKEQGYKYIKPWWLVLPKQFFSFPVLTSVFFCAWIYGIHKVFLFLFRN